MKRILFIAPHSFPIKSSESIDNAKVVYALAEMGYFIDVLPEEDSSSYPSDSSSIGRFKNSDRIFIHPIRWKRFKNKRVQHYKSVLDHLIAFLKTGYYYPGINYSLYAIKKAEQLLHSEYPESYVAIITRGFRCEVAGLYLTKKYHIKWIANWNDPYPEVRFPKPYGQGPFCRLSKSSEKILVDIQKYATIHTFPCERLKNYMSLYMTGIMGKSLVIPHMAHHLFVQNETPHSNRLELIHAGFVGYPRNPEKFLRAFSTFVRRAENPRIHCSFVGIVSPDFSKLVEELRIADFITYIPPCDYQSTINIISKSHISLIIEAECEEGIYLPTKVVDSIQCSKPLFCVSPSPGTLQDIICELHIGYFADNSDELSICRQIEILYKDYVENDLPIVDESKCSWFFEENVCSKYKSILEK